jgi:hypothetical protein
MNVDQVPEMLRKFIFDYVECETNQKDRMQKVVIWKHIEQFYLLYFVIGKQIPFNNKTYKLSHDDLIIYQMELFLDRILEGSREKMTLDFNLDELFSCQIDVFCKRMDSNRDVILSKESRLQESLDKLYIIIKAHPKGVSLGELIQRTRFFNTDSRHKHLTELIKQKRVQVDIDTSAGRQKKIYKAI